MMKLVRKSEIPNIPEDSENSNLYEQNTQHNDGKVRFLLEDDETPILDTDLKHQKTPRF